MTQLKTMYPGVANSPDTFLVEGLTIDGTVMYVADGAVFGEIPTLAVIGQAELAETVQITGKQSDGGYTIIRGVEGKRQAWAKATNVARNWTNKDYETLRANITVVNDGKVDKVEGKGLSTHDYDAAAKAKVDAIPHDPKYTDTVPDLSPYATKKESERFEDNVSRDLSRMNDELNAHVVAWQTYVEEAAEILQKDYDAKIATAKDALTVDINNVKTVHNADIKRLESQKLDKTDVINDLTTGGAEKALSAEQGKTLEDTKLNKADVVNDLTTGGADKALSAEQGKVLFTYADNGKKSIADAIVGKGVDATKSDDFNTLADKISKIKTGYGVGDVLPKESVEVLNTYVAPEKTWGISVTGGYIGDMTNSSDGAIYVVAGGTVSKISGDKIVWKLTVDIQFLAGVAVGTNGYVYCGGNANRIIKISTSGQKVREITGFTGYAGHYAIGSDGWICHSNGTSDGKILKISESGSRTEFATIGGIVGGIAIGPDGSIYAGNYNGDLFKISRSGQKSKITSLASSIGDIAVDSEGSIYVANGKMVSKISGGRTIWEFKPGTSDVYGVAIGSDGSIYAGHGSSVSKIS
mgnify:CR=1 FL=1